MSVLRIRAVCRRHHPSLLRLRVLAVATAGGILMLLRPHLLRLLVAVLSAISVAGIPVWLLNVLWNRLVHRLCCWLRLRGLLNRLSRLLSLLLSRFCWSLCRILNRLLRHHGL